MTSVTHSAALAPCVRIRAFFPCSLLEAENSCAFDKRAFVIQTALQLPDVFPELQLPTSSCGPSPASGTLDEILVDESSPALVLQPAEEVEMEEVEGGGDDEEQEAGGDGMDMKGENIEGQEAHFLQDFPLYIYSLSYRNKQLLNEEWSRSAVNLRLLDSDWSLCHGKLYNQQEWQEEGDLRRVPQQLPQGRHSECCLSALGFA